ncbi:MAG: hypothetical protein ACTSRS_09305 [Candidatus Helarchaeota archaeon]
MELTVKQKMPIQMGIAILIVLLMSYVIPSSWQPFLSEIGDVFGASGGVPIAYLSYWFFGIAIAWICFRENKYIASFLMYSFLPLGVIVTLEICFYFLYYDYVHLVPLIIDIYILWKSRNVLSRRWLLIFSCVLTGWIFLAYYLNLAYSAIPILMLALGLIIYLPVMVQLSFWLTHVKHPKRRFPWRMIKGLVISIWIFGTFLGSVLLYWYLRPNAANVDTNIVMDSWMVVTGQHNSNTDLIYWNKTGTYYLIHDRRPFHLGSPDAKLILWNSTDFHNWRKVIEFSVPDNDIRDPKFAVIDNRLFLYALKNMGVMATPYQTVFTFTEDGVNWQPFQDITQEGWLFWRPKTRDNMTWYVPAYWHEHGRSILLNSTDGINWTIVGTIWEGEGNDETAIEFLPDGRMLCTARLEGIADDMFGSAEAATFIATSAYPYTNWSHYIKSQLTRLDGPLLFTYNNKTYAIGRYHVGPRTYFTELGSVFSRKRTSIYLVNETSGLTYITDLPSGGDTSYAGAVRNGTDLFVSYYTSDITKDYSWLLGMVANSDIRIARINLTALAMLAESY